MLRAIVFCADQLKAHICAPLRVAARPRNCSAQLRAHTRSGSVATSPSPPLHMPQTSIGGRYFTTHSDRLERRWRRLTSCDSVSECMGCALWWLSGNLCRPLKKTGQPR